jgi:hypothetical protein
MAAPSWESKGADVSGSTAAPSFVVPGGAASNKIAIVSLFMDGASTTVSTVPSGFSVVPGCPVDAENHHLTKYWKRLTGADSGTYDFTLSASVFVEGAAELYNNCKSSGDPFDPSPGSAVDNTNGSISPAVSTSAAGIDRLILHSATCWGGGTWTSPTGFTKRINPTVGLVTTSDKTQASSGSTGSLTASTTTSDKRVAHVIALVGTSSMAIQSIADEARANMLADRGLVEPQLLSGADLMKLVLDDGLQTLVTKTDASIGTHYERYLITLRNS